MAHGNRNIISFYDDGECIAPFWRQSECYFYLKYSNNPCRYTKCKFYKKMRYCESRRAAQWDLMNRK